MLWPVVTARLRRRQLLGQPPIQRLLLALALLPLLRAATLLPLVAKEQHFSGSQPSDGTAHLAAAPPSTATASGVAQGAQRSGGRLPPDCTDACWHRLQAVTHQLTAEHSRNGDLCKCILKRMCLTSASSARATSSSDRAPANTALLCCRAARRSATAATQLFGVPSPPACASARAAPPPAARPFCGPPTTPGRGSCGAAGDAVAAGGGLAAAALTSAASFSAAASSRPGTAARAPLNPNSKLVSADVAALDPK